MTTPTRLFLPLAALALAALPLAGCSGTEVNPPPDPEPLTAQIAADVFAPLPASTGGPPPSGGRFTFYSLRENRVVLQHDNPNRADSASARWDVAFRGLTILVNGGTSGPGQGGAQVLTAAFGEVREAPAEGYRQDAAGAPAVPAGSGNGWYNYSGQTNLVTPVPGRVVVLRTADGRYAKLRVLSYYRGNPAAPSGQTDAPRYYTFEYVFQPDGSRGFETTTGAD